jgi:outer membrane protein assembly factor BamB
MRMLSRLVCLLPFFAAAGAANAAEPRLEWRFETKGKIYASPILADLDGDGQVEVVVCPSRESRVICLDGAGELRWDYRLVDDGNDGIQATPSAADMDGDGKKEVFFVTTGGTLGCLDYQGHLLWRAITGDRIDYSGPAVADITGNGRLDVVFGSDSGTVYCYDDAGHEQWHYQGAGQIRAIPAVAYHEPSGTHRVFVTFGKGGAACLDSAGEVVWEHNEPGPRGERRSGPAVGDLDGDGTLEVVLATEDFTVIVRDAFTGLEKWRWKGQLKIDQTNSFALANFDGPGLDILCGDGTGLGGPGRVYRLRNGAPLWSADVGSGIVQGPSVGDVDGDGQLETLVCCRAGRLACLSADGKEKWSYPTNAGSLTTPAIGDIDGDGKTEIVFTSKDQFVYCLTVDGDYQPERIPWPMMSGGPQLTGCATMEPFQPSSAPERPEIDSVLTVDGFDPLRTGPNQLTIALVNDAPRPRHLEAVAAITRPDGGVLTETITQQVKAYATHTEQFDFEAILPGTYSLTLRLVDMGTGEILVRGEQAAELELLALEQQEKKALAKHIRKLTGDLRDPALKARVKEAAASVLEPDTSGLAPTVRDFIEGRRASVSPTDLGSPREAVIWMNSALREMERFEARLRAAVASPGKQQDFAVVPDTTLSKVFQDEPYLTDDRGAAPCEIAVAGNEAEGTQIVVVPLWKDLANLRVSVSELRHADGAATIPADDVQVNRVGYIEIGPPEYNWFVEKRGLYPDVLFMDEPADVTAEQDAQPFFVTVHAHESTAPGDYSGVIRVEADGCDPIEVPLAVHVWDFALSKETHLKTSCWMSEGFLQRFYKYDGRAPFEARKRFYDIHLNHRMSPVKDFPLNGGAMLEDFEYLMANGQNAFFVGVPEYLEPGKRAGYAQQVLSTEALLKEKGWNDKALFYTRDEVAVVARHLIPKVVEMNNWLPEIGPDWPRLQTSAPEQALFDAVDIWCPTIDHFDPIVLEERMAKGDRLWFYTVWGRPGIMIEFPPTDYRLMLWQCWKYGAEGFLYWGTMHWDLNTTTDQRWPDIPWIPYNRQPGHNGCGYLIYPGPDATPLSSIRFELLRDGIEDYEYLYLLRELLQKKGGSIPGELRAKAEAELDIAPEVLVDHKQYTEDPETILGARVRIAGLIETLRKAVK